MMTRRTIAYIFGNRMASASVLRPFRDPEQTHRDLMQVECKT